jgi:hypothetical protein
MISVVQNFICNNDERLKVLLDNLPKLGKIFKDYTFYVNFNDTTNFEVVLEAYKKYIPDLYFYNELEKDWALVTLSLGEQVKTPYVIYLCEDQQVNMTKVDWDNIISEALLEQSVEYLLLTKIGKYTQSKFVQKQNTDIHLMPNIGSKNIRTRDMMPLKHGYLYRGGRSPHKRISTDAIYKTSFFVDRLKEFIPKSREDWTEKRIDWTDSNAGMKYFGPRIPFTDIQQPNFYEGYYDFHNGMKRFSDMKCYVPRKEVFIEYIDVLQKEERFENK